MGSARTLWRRAHGPLCSCGRLWARWTCGQFCRQSACLRSSSITSTTRSSSPQGVGTSPRTFQARNTLSCRGATCITSSNRGETRSKRSQSSSPASRLTSPTTGCSRPCSSPTSSTRHGGPQRWATVTGTHYSMRTTPLSASQLSRFRGREVNTSGDGFLATFDGPQRAIRCAMAIRDAVQALGIEVRAGLHTGEVEIRRRRHRRYRRAHRRPCQRTGRAQRRPRVQHAARPRDRIGARIRGPRRASTQGCARRMAPVRRRVYLELSF